MIPWCQKYIEKDGIYYSHSFSIFCLFSRWMLAAILNFENANKGTISDKSDVDSKHIKITLLKFLSIYIFISFRYIKKSNTHRLFLKCRTCKTAGFLNENSNRYHHFHFRYFLFLIFHFLKLLFESSTRLATWLKLTIH